MKERIDQEKVITRQLRTLFRAIQSHSKRVEKACGLSSIRLWMLHEIEVNPGITVSDLAMVMSIHRSTCSNMLDKLEDKELITRDRSKTDQRTVHLRTTVEGCAVLDKAPSPPEGMLSSSLGKLDAEQLLILERGLNDLLNVLHFDDELAALTPIQSD